MKRTPIHQGIDLKTTRLFIHHSRGMLASCLLAFLAVALWLNSHVQAEETSVKRPPPPAPSLPIENKFFCSAIFGSSLYTESRKEAKDNGITGTLFDATDRIAIKVEGDKLHFLTKASFEAGDVEDESPFKVLANDAEQVVAIDYDVGRGMFISTFALNRKTGIAVWSKSRSVDFLTLNPDNQSYVLSCEPRF